MKRWWFLFIVLAVLVGIFVARRYLFQKTNITVKPKRGPVVEAVYGVGTVTSWKEFQLKLGVPDELSKLFVKEGDVVKASFPLLRTGSGTIFRAPFTGTVTSLPFHEGETLSAQVPIITLTDLTDCYVSVSLEQQGALRVKKGQSVLLSFESLRGQKFTGKVRTIFPSGGQFFAHVDVENLPQAILPGMTADVAIEIARARDALLVPVRAVAGGKVVVIRNGKQTKTSVQLGIVDGEMAEIVSGNLTENDDLILPK